MSECRASDTGRSRGQTMSLRLEVGVDNEQITTSLSPDTRGSVTDVLSVCCYWALPSCQAHPHRLLIYGMAPLWAIICGHWEMREMLILRVHTIHFQPLKLIDEGVGGSWTQLNNFRNDRFMPMCRCSVGSHPPRPTQKCHTCRRPSV